MSSFYTSTFNMIYVLLSLVFIFDPTSCQPFSDCSNIVSGSAPILSEAVCNSTEVLSGECCTCDGDACEGCVPTPCPTTAPTASPTTSSPTDNPTASPTTSAPTTIPTVNPTDFQSTVDEDCPDCPYNVSLSVIGNITIEICPETTPSPTKFKGDRKKKKKKKNSYTKRTDPDDETPSPTPWMADRICVEIDEDGRRRLGRSKSGRDDDEDDGCDNDKTPSPTPSGFERWYAEKCDIDSYKGYHRKSYSYSSDAVEFAERYTSWGSRSDRQDAFLTEVCVTYSITGAAVACDAIESVFLGICENNSTNFNSSTLTADDLTALIVSVNNNSNAGAGIESAAGAMVDGALGILVTFAEGHSVTEFEICLGNVTVNSDFNSEKESIDIGEGFISTEYDEDCPADGLPCLNFFFDIPCPPESTTTTVCTCEDGMESLTLLYDPDNGLNATIVGYYNAKGSDAVLCEFENVAPGTEIVCTSDTYPVLSSSTLFTVTYIEESSRRRMGGSRKGSKSKISIEAGDCNGKVKTSCSEDIIGTTSYGCDDLEVVSFVSVDGSVCDEETVDAAAGSANALIDDNRGTFNSPLKVLAEMDPFVRYSLIGIMVAFVLLTLIACYICVARKQPRSSQDEDVPIKSAVDYGVPKTQEDDDDVQDFIEYDETDSEKLVQLTTAKPADE